MQDDEGRWWTKDPEIAQWLYYDNEANSWVRGTPRGYQQSSEGVQPEQAVGEMGLFCDLLEAAENFAVTEQYQLALGAYDRALSLRPDYPEAWYYKGNVLHDLGRYDEAVEAYDRVLGLRPDHPGAWNNKGSSLFQLGRYDEAVEACDRYLSLRPDDPEAWYYKGVALFNLDRHQEAVTWLCQAWRAREHFPDANLAANLLEILGHDPKECEKAEQQTKKGFFKRMFGG